MSNENNQTTKVVENLYNQTVPIKHPIDINGVPLNSVKLDFSSLTGDDILKIDEELRQEGHSMGFSNLWDQNVILKLAARGTKMIPEDLRRLHGADYLEIAFRTRNFFIQW